MPSRMERYYEPREGGPSRAKKNQELYEQINGQEEFENKEYMAKEYTNVEGFAKTPNKDTIDIRKIREMLSTREEKNKPSIKELYEQIEKKEESEPVVEENKNYDINDVLNKAKDERPVTDEENNFHSLKNVELDILKNLEINKPAPEEQSEEEKQDISQLFNTITSTSMLDKMGDDELSLDLLGDLKSNGTTMIGDAKEIKVALEEAKNNEQDDNQMDKSFYTSTLKFGKLKKLYAENDEEDDESENKSVAFKVIISILSLLALAIVVFIIFKIAN